MFYKKKGLPNESEVVVCTVTKMLRNSVFVKLDEYDRKEGLIHISEISPGRIRNIRDFVREGKQIICKVLRVYRERNQIDLSLRRVSLQLGLTKKNSFKQEQTAEKLLEVAGKKINLDLAAMYTKAGERIIEEYGALFPCFQTIVTKGPSLLLNLNIDKNIIDAIESIVKDRIKPPEVRIEETLSIKNQSSTGIEVIKKILKKALDYSKTKHYDFSLMYVGAPNFKTIVKSKDYKLAEKTLQDVKDLISKEAKATKTEVEFFREK